MRTVKLDHYFPQGSRVKIQDIPLGVEPKIGVEFYPPNHPFVHRVFLGFPFINHPFLGVGLFSPIFGSTAI